jgi:ergothioneine biosynthesis protein EgtC
MCRLAAYRGPERSVRALWLAPPHNLIVQSYAPREMNGALLNADGFGMAWYTSASPEPALYRSVLPLWADENVVRMAPHLVTDCALANVRSATPGMGIQTSNVSPFVRGAWAFTHNGLIRDFRGPVMRRMRDALDDAHYAAIEGNTDSEHLAAIAFAQLERANGDPTPALRRAFTVIEAALEGGRALMNVIATDGRWMIAARHAIGEAPPSLYWRARGGGIEIVSEPLDGEGWTAFEPHTLMAISPEREVRIEACRAS